MSLHPAASRTPESVASAISGAVSLHRFTSQDELPLQDALARLFTGMGLAFEREAVLGEHDRIDFLFEAGVGVEVKVMGGSSEVARQLWRYAASPRIESLILVTTLSRHQGIRLPVAHGKPVRIVRASWL